MLVGRIDRGFGERGGDDGSFLGVRERKEGADQLVAVGAGPGGRKERNEATVDQQGTTTQSCRGARNE